MISVNKYAQSILKEMLVQADELKIDVTTLSNGTCVIDAGINATGSLEAGRRIAEICLGGLGSVTLVRSQQYPETTWQVTVKSNTPILACLASQYAGWSLEHGVGKNKFTALGSGPGRAIGSKEPLFEEINYRDKADSTCIILEVDRIPPVEIAEKIAEQCHIDATKLTLIITPTTSLSGVVQIVARVLETALHKAHTLHFPLTKIICGSGTAPLCPISDDLITSMGRTNDAILFAGEVALEIDAKDDEISELAKNLPSNSSADYGKLFTEVFKAVGFDFYKIDPMLFSPAMVSLTSVRSREIFKGGLINHELIALSFRS